MSSAYPAPFPARSKEATADVGGVSTNASVTHFSDKILITIVQDGRLAHWVHVPLASPSPHQADLAPAPTSNPDDDPEDPYAAQAAQILPLTHLTATTILGGGDDDRNTFGQLVASQIASAVARRDADEKRLLVVGMGFRDVEMPREAFGELLRLVAKCL